MLGGCLLPVSGREEASCRSGWGIELTYSRSRSGGYAEAQLAQVRTV